VHISILAAPLISPVIPGTFFFPAAFPVVFGPFAGGRLFGLSQELIQTERILFIFLKLNWTTAWSCAPVRSAELLVRNKPAKMIPLLICF
jgi:hypothetical protein